jgi:hypothetical protein
MELRLLKENGVSPKTKVNIILLPGGNDSEGDLRYIEGQGWVSHLGLKSACSTSLLDYFQSIVASRPNQPLEPMARSVTRPADAGRAPALTMAHH